MGFRKRTQFLILASVFAYLAGTSFLNTREIYNNAGLSLLSVATGIAGCLCVLGSVLSLDIWQLNPAESHTLSTLYSQYRYLLYLRLKAPYIRWHIKRMTMDAKKTGEETLLRLLQTNKDTVYGKKHKFAEMKSRDDFVKNHPLTTQEHYQPYVEKLMNGESDILHSGKPVALIGTSGTTGVSKIYPFSSELVKAARYVLAELCPMAYLHMMNLQRYAQFHIYSPVGRSPGGVSMAAGTQVVFLFPQHNLIPVAYSKLHLEDQSYYAQAVFSLAERELRWISGFSADLMYSYWKFITKHWQQLCEDISKGEIGKHINMPEDVRKELSASLEADPDRAAELQNAMKKGTVGLAKRIWPDIKFMLMGKSAAFKLCSDALMADHLNGLRIIDFSHAATEGVAGVKIAQHPEDTADEFTLTLFPSFFLEFIPIENVEEEQPSTVFPEQVKVGKLYEIVHTNPSGLYRTRYGDIVKIVGFTNGTPKYNFLYKLGQRLNIAYERTPDQFLIQAVSRETKNLSCNIKLVDFTSTESTLLEKIRGNTPKGHYVFFMEFDSNEMVNHEEIAKRIDLTLIGLYAQYKRFKDIDSIGPLEIIQVKCGTFDGLKSYIWNDKPHGQFKMPRVLRREPALKYLLEQAVCH